MTNDDGDTTSSRRVEYPTGEPMILYSMRDGRLHSEYRTFYQNGTLQTIGRFDYGVKVGLSETFFSNGKAQSRCNYANGTLDGESIMYSPTGDVLYIKNYANGTLDGLQVDYDVDGAIMSKTLMSGGKLHGQSLRFFRGIPETRFFDNNIDITQEIAEECGNLTNVDYETKMYITLKWGIPCFKDE